MFALETERNTQVLFACGSQSEFWFFFDAFIAQQFQLLQLLFRYNEHHQSQSAKDPIISLGQPPFSAHRPYYLNNMQNGENPSPQVNNIRVKMYRQSNDRYNQGNNMNAMNPYLPHMPPKMHMQSFNPSIPPYPDPSQNMNSYDFPPNYPPPPSNYPNPPPNQNYQRSYPPNWREMSEPKGPMSNMLSQPPPLHNLPSLPMHYDVRGLSNNNDYQSKPPSENYMIPGNQSQPQLNIVVRLSGIIKSQISVLQGIMRYTQKKTNQEKQKKERSRSRSRQRKDRPRQRQHRQWNCSKCAFLNFDFRDRCKRCNEPKQGRQRGEGVGGGRNYVPGPDDWRCLKCSNINYARRLECHRCHAPRPK